MYEEITLIEFDDTQDAAMVFRATIDIYDGNGDLFQTKLTPQTPDLPDRWSYYGYTMRFPAARLPYDVEFTFLGRAVHWQEIITPGTYQDWYYDINVTTPDQQWNTADNNDPTKYPHCQMGWWDDGGDAPFTNRQMDCRWSCPIMTPPHHDDVAADG